MEIKFPHIEVKLTGIDGNAFSIMGATTKAMRRANVPEADIQAYKDLAMSGDYDNLLQVTMRTVSTS